MSTSDAAKPQTLFGHPPGLFTLFFAEMWERFSFYGMKALLLLYMTKGFLSFPDSEGYAVFGAYAALVYMTPFFGGIIADRLLGGRRAVILGGLLMAAGHLLLTVEQREAFFLALGLLIVGNGFFKPNISTMVGALYPEGSPKRDGGFTIFYMGINLGAAMAGLLCGYIGETYGYHYGFGLATLGMLAGLAVFANWIPPGTLGQPPDPQRLKTRPVIVSQVLLMGGALAAAVALFWFHPSDPFLIALNVAMGIAVLAAVAISCWSLRGASGGVFTAEWAVYGAAVLSVPVFALVVSGFSPLTANKRGVMLIPASITRPMMSGGVTHAELAALRDGVESKNAAALDMQAKRLDELHEGLDLREDQYEGLKNAVALARAGERDKALAEIDDLQKRFPEQRLRAGVGVFLKEISKPAPLILLLCMLGALGYLIFEAARLDTVGRQRMVVVFVLTFFALVFFSFFEQSASSVNLFTDRNVDRVTNARRVTADDVGTTIEMRVPTETNDAELKKLPTLTQAQLGHRHGNPSLNDQIAAAIRAEEKRKGSKSAEDVDDLVKAVTKDDFLTMTSLTYLRTVAQRDDAKPEDLRVNWVVTESNIGMPVGGAEIPTTLFQSVNSIYILLFGVGFTALWGFLAARKIEPSTPAKFALGLVQVGLAFAALWYGAKYADAHGIVGLSWLLLAYLLLTTGELCLSPVGLSMITRMAPKHLVSTVMGAWFLATAFSETMASIIAQFTGVGHGGDFGVIPVPSKTVGVYGHVFGVVAVMALCTSVVAFAVVPILKRWMHEEPLEEPAKPEASPTAKRESLLAH